MLVWLVVIDGGIPLSEVMKWDLEDIDAFLGILEMESDMKAAVNAYHSREIESNGRR